MWRKKRIAWLLLCLPFCLIGAAARDARPAPQWSVYELTFAASGKYANPYTEVSLRAVFTGPGDVRQTIKGFWDGDNVFKIRFTPTIQGDWSYVTESNDAGLNAKRGSFKCVAPERGGKGFLRRDAAHPYHFIFDDGTRFFMWGTTYYGVMLNAMAGDNWKEAVTRIRAYGINKARMYIYSTWRPGGVTPYPPTLPFETVGDSVNRDRLNLPFWRRLDDVVRFMAENDLLADLIVFWSNPDGYGATEQNHRYASYAVARYAAFPNVTWCVSNEWNYTKKPREMFNDLGKLIKAEDAWSIDVRPGRQAYVRALSAHQQTRPDFQFFDQSWPSHAIVQFGVRNRGKSLSGGDEWRVKKAVGERGSFRHGDEWGNYSIVFNYGHRMPVVNDEYGYIGEPVDRSEPKGADGKYPRFTRAKHRQTAWGIAVGGGYGSAGDKNDYDDGRPYNSVNWHDTDEYGDLKRLIDFFTTKDIAYWRMTPRNELKKSGERVYVLAEPGKQYVIYAAAGGSFSVELVKGDYEVRRYDPRAGEDVALNASQGGVKSFTLPDKQDWVIYLRARSAATSTAGKQAKEVRPKRMGAVNRRPGRLGY